MGFEFFVKESSRQRIKANRTQNGYLQILAAGSFSTIHHSTPKETSAKSRKNVVPHTWVRVFGDPDRGMAKIAMSPLTRVATAATANAGEFPPPNS